MASKIQFNCQMHSLNCRGKLLSLQKPVVMGILNITPDSFYTGQMALSLSQLLQMARQMAGDGAAIIDIGGQSSRPGSDMLPAQEEAARVLPVIQYLKQQMPQMIFSIDTFYSEVAAQAVEAGASIVNDISAGNMDSNMLSTVAMLRTPYICMHMQGTPATMQQQPVYDDVTLELLQFFIAKTEQCKQAGITDIVLDPGFGFGKTVAHNYTLLKNLAAFKMLERPLLVGLSRKSMIQKVLGCSAGEALNGTTVLNTLALQNGAGILRVHDVKQAAEAIGLVEMYNEQ